jgi:hypothetical protein
MLSLHLHHICNHPICCAWESFHILQRYIYFYNIHTIKFISFIILIGCNFNGNPGFLINKDYRNPGFLILNGQVKYSLKSKDQRLEKIENIEYIHRWPMICYPYHFQQFDTLYFLILIQMFMVKKFIFWAILQDFQNLTRLLIFTSRHRCRTSTKSCMLLWHNEWKFANVIVS